MVSGIPQKFDFTKKYLICRIHTLKSTSFWTHYLTVRIELTKNWCNAKKCNVIITHEIIEKITHLWEVTA